jgi:hypothetical protein
MTYHPSTLAQAWADALVRAESAFIVLGDFLDDWRREAEPDARWRLVRDPLPDATDPERHRWAAFLAATVEYLTVRDGVPTPAWVFDERWVLPTPWFLLPQQGPLWAWQLVATPPPWKRRRIFGGDETMLIGRV